LQKCQVLFKILVRLDISLPHLGEAHAYHVSMM
jgi:hypothetical protein